MKRIGMIILCMVLTCMLACPVQAAQEAVYGDAGEMYDAWVVSGAIPDYISGVWSSDGGHENLTVGIVLGQEAQAQALPGLLRQPDSLTIVYQKYAWNQLRQVQSELEAYLQEDLGFVGVGIDVYENRVKGEIHRDFRQNADTQALVQQLRGQYGDMVEFQYVDGYIQFTDQPIHSWTHWIPQQAQPMGLLLLLVCIAVALLTNGYILRKQRYRLWNLQRGQGGLEEAPGRYTLKAVEASVRGSCPEYPASLDGRLRDTLSKGK